MKTHGKSGTPEYICWKNIIQRCFNKNNPSYKYYGTGISFDRFQKRFRVYLSRKGIRKTLSYKNLAQAIQMRALLERSFI